MQGILRRFTLGVAGQLRFNSLVCAAMLILAPMASGQDRASSTPDIYATSLIEASRQMEKAWGHLQLEESRTPLDYKHLLVSKEQSVPAEYPAAVDGRRFEYLTSSELLVRRKAAKRDLPVLIVRPATIEAGRVKVLVSQDWIGMAKGHLQFKVSDWGAVFFRFDCRTGQFRFDEVILGGI